MLWILETNNSPEITFENKNPARECWPTAAHILRFQLFKISFTSVFMRF